MNESIDRSISICPEYASAVQSMIQAWYPKNITFDQNSNHLASYACKSAYILDIQTRYNWYGALGKWMAFGFGLFGSILALITLSRREYSTCVTMLYHRWINFLEIFSSLFCLQSAAQISYGDRLMRSGVWAVITVHVAEKLRNVLFAWVNLIVLWVAAERVLACLFVSHFELINRRKIARIVIASAGVSAVIIFLPYGFGLDYFYDPKTGAYKIVASDWSKWSNGGYGEYTLGLSIYLILHSSTLFATSCTALIGLIKMTKRKRALTKSAWKRSSNSRALMKHCKFNIQLCILQMCETVPCISNQFLFVYITIRYVFIARPELQLGAAAQRMTHTQAMINADSAIDMIYLNTINGIGALISHFTRFYSYLIFSPRVRRSFLAIINGRYNQIDTTDRVTQSKSVIITVTPAVPRVTRF